MPETTTGYLRVRNFEKFQSFNFKNLKNDPKPTWIKLWTALLDDEEFFELPDAYKFHVVGIMLVASQHDNRFKANIRWLEKQIGAQTPIDLERLLKSKFIERTDPPAVRKLDDFVEGARQEAEDALKTTSPLEDRDSILDPEKQRLREEKIREEEIRKEKEKQLSILLSNGFERLWNLYPVKDGRKQAERHFSASVKTEQDLTDIDVALTNYLRHVSLNDWKRHKSGQTWFNNWRDWLNWKEPTLIPPEESPEAVEQVRQIFRKHKV